MRADRLDRDLRAFSGVTLVVLAIGLAPLWQLALDTPFRLIDDYLDWRIVVAFRPWHYLWTELSLLGGDRFRPLFDLGNLACWTVFGTHPGWHHAWRLLLKAAGFVPFAGAIRNLTGSPSSLRHPLTPPLLVYAFSLYFFFPNNPEARLAPQELAGSVAFAAFAWALTGPTVNRVAGRWSAAFALAAFTLAKEPNAIPATVMLAWLIWELGGTTWSRRLSVVVPCVSVIGFCTVRAFVASRFDSYGHAPISWDLLVANARFAGRVVLLVFASPWVPLLLLGPLVVLAAAAVPVVSAWRRGRRLTAGEARIGWLAACAGGLAVAYLTSWLPVLRYAYPLTTSLLMLNCIGVAWLASGFVGRFPIHTRPVGMVLVLLACCSAGVNYCNTASQFASQWVAGRTEQRLLARIDQLIAEGDWVAVPQTTELDRSIRTYFAQFLPHFGGPRTRMETADGSVRAADILVARGPATPEWHVVEAVRPVDPPAILAFARSVSAALDLRWGPPYVFLDSGAQAVRYPEWTFLRPEPAAGDRRAAVETPPRETVILSRQEPGQQRALPAPR